jgi:hypothetical protein
MTEVWDTAVSVGSAAAQVVSVDRTGCDDCDACRDDNTCTDCSTCETCDASCDVCVETVTIVVPDVGAGTWDVEVVNRHGRSPAGTLTVTGAVDTGIDTGVDTGVDTGGTDTGVDTGGSDTGSSDTGSSDTGAPVDTGA